MVAPAGTGGGVVWSQPVPLPLQQPETIGINVTAQDPAYHRIYAVVVTRRYSDDVSLRTLAVSVGSLAPSFSPHVTAYGVTMPWASAEASLTVSLCAFHVNCGANFSIGVAGSNHTVAGTEHLAMGPFNVSEALNPRRYT